MRLSHALTILSFITAVALTCSCHKEYHGTGIIRPVVKGVDTKSAPIIIDDKANSSEAGTNTEKISVKGFIMDAWLASEGHDNETGATVDVHYFTKTAETPDGSVWNIDGKPKWINGIATRFWCWNKDAEQSGLAIKNDYSSTSDTRNFSFAVPGDASKRGDIVMAYTKKTWTDSKNDEVNFRFYHPVANICFVPNTDPDGFSDNIVITEISLLNVSTKGDFSFTFKSPAANDGEPQTALFTWSNLSAPETLSESVDNIDKATGDKLTKLNFFIPEQAISTDTRLRVTFRKKNDNAELTREASLYDSHSGFDNRWKSGGYYKYRIKAVAVGQGIEIDATIIDWTEMEYEYDVN